VRSVHRSGCCSPTSTSAICAQSSTSSRHTDEQFTIWLFIFARK
jgi:hypothetical protein